MLLLHFYSFLEPVVWSVAWDRVIQTSEQEVDRKAHEAWRLSDQRQRNQRSAAAVATIGICKVSSRTVKAINFTKITNFESNFID